MNERDKVKEQATITSIITHALEKNGYSWQLDVKQDLWIRVTAEWKLLMPFRWQNK